MSSIAFFWSGCPSSRISFLQFVISRYGSDFGLRSGLSILRCQWRRYRKGCADCCLITADRFEKLFQMSHTIDFLILLLISNIFGIDSDLNFDS